MTESGCAWSAVAFDGHSKRAVGHQLAALRNVKLPSWTNPNDDPSRWVYRDELLCPNDPYRTGYFKLPCSYGANGNMAGYTNKTSLTATRKVNLLSAPSTVFLLKDCPYFWMLGKGDYANSAAVTNLNGVMVPDKDMMPNWHHGRTNLTFYDGHVEDMRYDLPKEPASADNLTAENRIWGVPYDRTKNKF